MSIVAEISNSLKMAREVKGLSQRALADLSGVPQSHISKIESGSVDLRISSLVEIARALDMELKLVPRKGLSAVNSIIRSTQFTATMPTRPMLKAMTKLQSAADKLAASLAEEKEVVQLQSRIHELSRINVPSSKQGKIEELTRQLQRVVSGKSEVSTLKRALDEVKALRNALAHQTSGESVQPPRSVYALDGDDDG